MAVNRKPPSFRLTKWYLDCIAATGDILLIYAADVRLGPLRFHCGSLLRAFPDGRVLTNWTVRPGSMPDARGDELTWACEALKLAGRWKAAAAPVGSRLLEDESGFIEWRAEQPRAEAVIQLGSESIAGVGYAERLEVAMNSLRLPIEELRWGRFHGTDGGHVVWIFWRGPKPLALVIRNGRVDTRARGVEGGLEISGGGLQLGRERVLRCGLTGKLISALPLLIAQQVPAAFRNIEERKWAGKAVLSCDGAVIEGQAIHEIARFPVGLRRPRTLRETANAS
jgi:hypothetical protein